MVNTKNLPQVVFSRLKQYHHVRLDAEFKQDCATWLAFLDNTSVSVVNRPMIDLALTVSAEDISFSSDASAAHQLGFGSILGSRWIFGAWGTQFMKQYEPRIEYLELYALCAGVITWSYLLKNCRIIVYCDNQAVVGMINEMASSCPKCMKLLRLLVLSGLTDNRRIFARYISSKSNFLADSLSRLDFDRFRKLGPHTNQYPDTISPSIWPIGKIWEDIKK